MKVLSSEGLQKLIQLIKQNFFAKTDGEAVTAIDIEEATTISVDSSPTSESSNLVTSGGVYTAVSAKSAVSVSNTGTSTDEVQYITIDGVEKKLAGGSGGASVWGSITGNIEDQTDLQSALATKSAVSVSASGTATDVIQYITVDGIEKKLPSGGSGGTAHIL